MFAGVQLLVLLVLYLVAFVMCVYALVDAARRPASAFTSAGKRTKGFWLTILGVMNSLISMYYYLRITVLIYMKPAEAELGPVAFSPGVTAVLAATAVGVMLIGIFPGALYDLAMNAVKIFPGL